MKKFLLLAALAACSPTPQPPPPPPPPPPCKDCEPPPPPAANPEDYFTIERANEFFLSPFEDDGVVKRLQRLHWGGYVDVLYVLDHCRSSFGPVFHISGVQAEEFAAGGFDLEQEGGKFKANFQKVNRRCEVDSRFCGRVEVRKDRWQDYVERFDAHMKVADDLREDAAEAAEDTACEGTFDSIAGWCQNCR